MTETLITWVLYILKRQWHSSYLENTKANPPPPNAVIRKVRRNVAIHCLLKYILRTNKSLKCFDQDIEIKYILGKNGVHGMVLNVACCSCDCFYWFCVWGLGEGKDSVSLLFVRSSQQVGKQLLMEGAVPCVCYCKRLPSTEEPLQALASCVYPAHGRALRLSCS